MQVVMRGTPGVEQQTDTEVSIAIEVMRGWYIVRDGIVKVFITVYR